MPSRSAKPCGKPGCKALVRGATRCAEHTREREQARGSATQRGYDATWRAFRAAHLSAHPMCSHPACDLIATDVDHVTPHRGDDGLRLDPDNLQSLCHGHHSSKTVAQDGGLGRMRLVGEGRYNGVTIRQWRWEPNTEYEKGEHYAWSQTLDAQDEEPSV